MGIPILVRRHLYIKIYHKITFTQVFLIYAHPHRRLTSLTTHSANREKGSSLTNASKSICPYSSPQSLTTKSPAPWPAASPASAQAREVRKLGHVTSMGMFFSSTGACTATKYLIPNHRRPIDAQLYFASVTQMFLMLIFVKVESDSSKLLRTVSKSGPNGCKERSRPQKMLMRIK